MKNRFLTLCAALFVAGALQAQDYTSYLFAYFSGNHHDGEQVRYAISEDVPVINIAVPGAVEEYAYSL